METSMSQSPETSAPLPVTPGDRPSPVVLEGPPATPPPDAGTGESLRAAAMRAWLAARTPALWTWGIARRRTVAVPAVTLVNRLLVIRTDRLGDMALTTAALADLRTHFRHARITVLAPKAPLALLEAHPAVDHLVELAGKRLPEELKGRVDLALDFTPDETLLGALLAAATQAPWRAGFGAAGRGVFFSLRGPRARRDRHIVDLNRELLAALGVPRRHSLPRLFVRPQETAEALARCAALGSAAPRVVVHPGGRYPSQRWMESGFVAVIGRLTERLGAACLLLGGPGEEAMLERIRAATPDALPIGPLSVRQMVALLSVADLFLGSNSGPLHVAAALGVPTLSLMGPTDPIRFMPCGPADHVVRRPIACAPCNRGTCWHHTCLRSIEPEEVARAAQAILAEPRGGRQAA
jgi:ADP-heptose:LPS heptosyltransferase